MGSGLARESLYFVVDVFLTVGLIGFYAPRSKSLGWPGAAGLAIALGGIATVRASVAVSTVDLYPVGAFATACGMIAVSARAWVVRNTSGWVPLAFVLSTLVGTIGTVVENANALSVWAGIIFGIAFAGLGFESSTSTSQT